MTKGLLGMTKEGGMGRFRGSRFTVAGREMGWSAFAGPSAYALRGYGVASPAFRPAKIVLRQSVSKRHPFLQASCRNSPMVFPFVK